jgi:Tfp pilus assembly protein PilN
MFGKISFRVSFLAAFLLLLFFLGSAGFSFYLVSLERQINQIQQELHGLQPVVNEAQRLREENLRQEQKIASLQSLLGAKVKWGEALTDIGEAMPEDLWLTRLSFDETGALSIQGKAGSLVSIGLLQQELAELSQLAGVALRHAEIVDVGNRDTTIHFEIIGSLSQGGGEKQGVGETVP